MMFAPREEPIVVRFLSYQFSRTINVIFNSLNGLFIWQDSGNNRYTGFIGRFAKYLISRHLKVNKKYEAWFRFAGKPIRFSLREFAIVIVLPCGKFPTKSKSKMKKNITNKPYWPTLFGKVELLKVYPAVKNVAAKDG
ncbi:hypothetical protein Bca4012_089905 [Brassica carinata]|uniref:DUF1985 domain-containing protein n=1 Tax=Brassica carinata TaxID=52824 RepID=A0A8X7PAD5_BRACI|nr:hypothetical protein Bca52824_086756 [Brassica carinata]